MTSFCVCVCVWEIHLVLPRMPFSNPFFIRQSLVVFLTYSAAKGFSLSIVGTKQKAKIICSNSSVDLCLSEPQQWQFIPNGVPVGVHGLEPCQHAGIRHQEVRESDPISQEEFIHMWISAYFSPSSLWNRKARLGRATKPHLWSFTHTAVVLSWKSGLML